MYNCFFNFLFVVILQVNNIFIIDFQWQMNLYHVLKAQHLSDNLIFMILTLKISKRKLLLAIFPFHKVDTPILIKKLIIKSQKYLVFPE